MAIPVRPSSLFRRSGLLLVVASLAAFGSLLAVPRPVAACSCAMSESLKEHATAEQAIFTGTAGQQQDRGVPVDVERWLWGQNAAPVVWLAASSFGDSAGCGTNPPRPGSHWLWVTWLPGNKGDFGTGLCSPAGDLDTPEGQEMLAEALAIFDEISVPAATPVQTAEPPNTASAPDPATAARDRAAITILGSLLIGSLALFGVVLLVGRRSGRHEG
ncbi:MAG: hypothetical protein H0U52_00090 [Chloroflexi bacterium]|nr:hypothetical protein [Chloroflexota bacterium]